MPRINPNSAERVAWRNRNSGLVEWLTSYTGTNGFVQSIRSSLNQYGSLTQRQAEAVIRVMEEAQNAADRTPNAADRAAGPDDCPHIYNGVYTMDDGAEHLTFQVYTVIRGRLQGKRIVKRQLQYGEYQGFAFVGQSGGLELWRRFADQAEERYVVWARQLLEVLNASGQMAPGLDTITNEAGMTIQRSRNCRRCNRALTVPTSIESGIGPECARRSASENRTTVADPHATGTTLSDVGASAMTLTGLLREQRAADALNRRRPTLSELGTGEIQ